MSGREDERNVLIRKTKNGRRRRKSDGERSERQLPRHERNVLASEKKDGDPGWLFRR